MEIPEVRYLSTERGAIAYQCFGGGDRTIIWNSPPSNSIETRWTRPGALKLWEFLASLGTVVIFDHRGLGSSDRLPIDRVGDLDELVFDIDAVVSELATRPTVLIATGTATIPAASYAAANGGHLDRLVLLNAVSHHPRRDTTDPDTLVAEIVRLWGTGEVLARAAGMKLEPSQRWDAGRNERIVCSPTVAGALTRAFLSHDASSVLGDIAVPTLVIHTGDLIDITPEQTEAVASAIPDATYMLRPSSFFNWGEWDGDIHRFITGTRPPAASVRDLAAIMFTDVVGSSSTASERGDALWRETLGRLDEFVGRVAAGEHGRIVKQTGDGHLIEFGRPGDALAAACQLVDEVGFLGVTLRVGLHFGEVERRPDGDIGGIAVHLAARIVEEAAGHEILVSRTVADLTVGDGRTYAPRGTSVLRGIPGEWQLLSLVRR